MSERTDDINTNRVNLLELTALIIHQAKAQNPDHNTGRRAARVFTSLRDQLEPWVNKCLKDAAKTKEPVAASVARMVVVAMTTGYEWLAATVADELQDAGITAEDFTVNDAFGEMQSREVH